MQNGKVKGKSLFFCVHNLFFWLKSAKENLLYLSLTYSGFKGQGIKSKNDYGGMILDYTHPVSTL